MDNIGIDDSHYLPVKELAELVSKRSAQAAADRLNESKDGKRFHFRPQRETENGYQVVAANRNGTAPLDIGKAYISGRVVSRAARLRDARRIAICLKKDLSSVEMGYAMRAVHHTMGFERHVKDQLAILVDELDKLSN